VSWPDGANDPNESS